MLLLRTLDDRGIEAIPTLIQRSVGAPTELELFPLGVASIQPEVEVKLGGIPVNERCCTCRGEDFQKPCRTKREGGFCPDILLETQFGMVVGACATRSCRVGGTLLRAFAYPGHSDERVTKCWVGAVLEKQIPEENPGEPVSNGGGATHVPEIVR
jgi:hypothetical protein